MIKDTLKQAGKKISDQVYKSYEKGKDYLKRFTQTKDKPITGQSKSDQKLMDLLTRVDESSKHMDSHFVSEDFQSEVHSYVRQLASEGFYNGVAGLKTDNYKLKVKQKAANIFAGTSSAVAEKKAQITDIINAKQKILGDKVARLALHHEYQKYLHHHYKFNERGYSKWEFWLYFICYIVLFVADLPLSAEMLKCLFTVNMNDEASSLLPITEHLNVILIAIGMGISTIFIKYCYDEFVGKKYGHKVISHKKFEELFSPGDTITGLDQTEIKDVKNNQKIESRIKVGLLLFTILTIIIIGIFRGAAWSQLSEDGDPVSVYLVSATMIFVTLLFALVGGACLSLALAALTNSNRMKNSKNEAIILEREYTEYSKELSHLKGELAYTEEYSTKIGNGEEWEIIISDFLASYYKMGFDEGYSNPGYFMQQMSYFDRVIHWREQAISRKINSDINN